MGMEDHASSPLGMDRPLKGLRVVELASVLAGPLAGSFFAELGAEVIKVENPATGGDVTRQWRSADEPLEGPSAYYVAANGPKEIRMLDLKKDGDQAALNVLLSDADIVLQNFKPSGLVRLGLDPEALALRHPHLIHVHLKGFLSDANRPGYDMVVQAETGFMAMNGAPGGDHFRMPVALMDVLAAHQMRSAALLALWQRERDGLGSYLEVWLDASGLSALANRATEYLVAGHEPAALGALHPQIAPYGETFWCRCGGQIVTAVGNDPQFQALCDLLHRPEWGKDKRFSSNPERVQHRSVLAQLMAPAFLEHSADFILAQALECGVPLGRVNPVSAALQSDSGRAMTATFEAEGRTVQHVRQVAFKIHRNGKRST